MENFNIPADVTLEAENSSKAGGDLTVPEGVARSGKVARWQEAGVVQSAHREPSIGKRDEQRTMFVIKMNVIPYNDSPNPGRSVWHRIRVNFGVLTGNDAAAGQRQGKDIAKEKKYAHGELGQLVQFAKALGYDTSAGWNNELTEALFPEETSPAKSAAVGETVIFGVTNTEGEQWPQDTKGFLPYEGA